MQIRRFGRLVTAALLFNAASCSAAPQAWVGDFRPIEAADWNAQRAAHLLERAGFGALPDEIARFAAMGPAEAVRSLVEARADPNLPSFDASDIFDQGLEPFPPSRPATTDAARRNGQALGVMLKPGGDRRAQAVVDKFFYWLRASRLETDRLAYWWAQRMLTTNAPLQEKLALFWHGHFATSEDKVRDVRKMRRQLGLFETAGLGSFRDLMIGVAQDPAMLAFLDAGVNVKAAPNENFAREIMELFTMGVGHYTEADIREAARAFTGWNSLDLAFHVDPARHDDGPKTVLGRRGDFDGVQVIDLILAQPATAEFVAGKLYRYFVRDELSPELGAKLGAEMRSCDLRIDCFMRTVLISRDFYSDPAVATRIKPPVELVVSTYRRLGLREIPGMPDFNDTTDALGQRLFHPPTVAGWAQGRAWITPGLLIERGNFVEDALFPNITQLPADRYPVYPAGSEIAAVHEKIRAGVDITTATRPAAADMTGDTAAMSNAMVDRDEDFNTRYGSYRGWQMAVERVKPIARGAARIDLSGMVLAAHCNDSRAVVDEFARRFFDLELDAQTRDRLASFLSAELGTSDIARASTYMEDPLRMLLHAMLSLPEYQLD